jgi:PEP-CTERM motif-containing protein
VSRLQLRVTALVACLCNGVAAHAVPFTYDFAGFGSVCTYAGNASCASTYDGAFTGSITIDVLANGPSGADSFTNATTLAYDYSGWVQSDFLIQWGGHSFNPGPVTSQVSGDNYVQLANDFMGADQLFNRESYQGFDGSTNFYSSAGLTRQSANPSWLTDLSFPAGLGLAPGPGAFNQLNFSEYSQSASGVYAGFSGMASLSSLTVRTTSVPEPGTLALFGIGLVGLGLCRRRQAMS